MYYKWSYILFKKEVIIKSYFFIYPFYSNYFQLASFIILMEFLAITFMTSLSSGVSTYWEQELLRYYRVPVIAKESTSVTQERSFLAALIKAECSCLVLLQMLIMTLSINMGGKGPLWSQVAVLRDAGSSRSPLFLFSAIRGNKC